MFLGLNMGVLCRGLAGRQFALRLGFTSVNAYDRKHKPKNPFVLPRKLPPRVAQENLLPPQENWKDTTGELFTPYRRIEKVPQGNRLPAQENQLRY